MMQLGQLHRSLPGPHQHQSPPIARSFPRRQPKEGCWRRDGHEGWQVCHPRVRHRRRHRRCRRNHRPDMWRDLQGLRVGFRV